MPQTGDLRAPCLPRGQQLGPGEAAGSPCWTNQGARGRPELTICTHSTRGSLTAWFPLSDTTQAGVSGVAWRRATTASTPMRLAWK